jgi:ABC-type multidrug transport system fused ATPase/permease subunit
MKNIWRLLSLVPQFKKRLVLALGINSALGLVGLINPQLYKRVLDLVVESVNLGASTEVIERAGIALALLLGVGLLGVLFDYIGERISDRLFMDIIWEIRKKVFTHLSKLSIDYYEKNRSGEIMERISSGTMEFARWAHSISDGFLGVVVTIILVLGFLWIKIPLVGMLMTVSLILNFYWAIQKITSTQPIRKQWSKKAERAMGEMGETLSQIATVRSFSQESHRFNRYSEEIAEYHQLRLAEARIQWRTNSYRGVLNVLTVVGAISIVAWGAIHGTYTVGDILMVSLYMQQIRGNISPLSRLLITTGEIETSSERLVTILDADPTVADSPNAVPLTKLETIEFQSVSFQYPGKETAVLRDVSFTLPAGKSLALVGPSGVGKTTITKLLLRFYAPTGGQILINGKPIEAFTQDSIRQKIGMVMQDVALFNDSIEENIKFARPGATESEIKTATTTAHADDFIQKLPDDYRTLVGERGIKLSGGEKQRVAIARAILKDPQLVILDEATSALDSQSEKFVQDGLRALLSDKTAIIIAHRLSTVMRADTIVVLKDGSVHEQGKHADLIKKKGLYAKLFSMQSDSLKDYDLLADEKVKA